MHRPLKTMFVLITVTLVCCCSRQTAALTLRFGPLDEVGTSMPGAAASDLPTPQLFRLVIRQDDAILGVTHPSEGFGVTEPAIGLPETAVPPPARTSERQTANRQLRPHRLSGVELLLLRDIHMMAEQPEETRKR